MLHSTRTPTEKRRLFRERLASGELVQLPGAFTPLSARLIEAKGFDGIFMCPEPSSRPSWACRTSG